MNLKKLSASGSFDLPFALSLSLISGLVAGCHGQARPDSAVKDIATDSGGTGVSLYYRADQSIVRAQCPAGTQSVNLDRAHCTGSSGMVSAAGFIAKLSAGVGDSIDLHAKNVQDFYAGITSIQNELLQLLAAAPSIQAQVQNLQQGLAISESTVGSEQAQLDAFDQQVAAIRTRLAAHADVDLSLQLASILDQRDALLAKLNLVKDEEQKSRQALISANSSTLDPATFNDVRAQLDAALQQLAAEQAQFAAAMDEVSDLNKTVAHLNDPSFTFDVLEAQSGFATLKPFTRRFEAVFAAQAAEDQAAAAALAAARAQAAWTQAAAILAAAPAFYVTFTTIMNDDAHDQDSYGVSFKATDAGVICWADGMGGLTSPSAPIPISSDGKFSCSFSSLDVEQHIDGVVSNGVLTITWFAFDIGSRTRFLNTAFGPAQATIPPHGGGLG